MTQKAAPNLGATAQDVISILAVVTAEQAARIERIVSHTRWHMRVVDSIHDAVHALRSLPVSVVLCEDRLRDGTWLDIVRATEHLCPRPQTIVLSGSADPALWEEVINCGGYDLLAMPLEPREVYALVPPAWRRRNSMIERIPTRAAELKPNRELARVS